MLSLTPSHSLLMLSQALLMLNHHPLLMLSLMPSRSLLMLNHALLMLNHGQVLRFASPG
jgi:hypothetical protein